MANLKISTEGVRSKNENCLEGIRCPQCGNEDRFRIIATALFEVTDDGTESCSEVEWDDDSIIICRDCDHMATVGKFTTKD